MLLLTRFRLLLLLRCQMLTLGPEDSLDFLRSMRMASYGFLISGPTLHLWFNFISKLFPKKDVVNTLKKMFLGQAVYGPIINSVFFSYNSGLQGTIAYMPPYTSGLLVLIELHKNHLSNFSTPSVHFSSVAWLCKSFFDHKLFLQ
jgi:protein Mpv17